MASGRTIATFGIPLPGVSLEEGSCPANGEPMQLTTRDNP